MPHGQSRVEAPFHLEELPVLFHGPHIIDILSLEGEAALVMNEDIARDPNLKAGKRRSITEVVVFKIPYAEQRIQSPYSLDHRFFYQHAESDNRRNGKAFVPVSPSPVGCEGFHLLDSVVPGFLNNLWPCHVIGHGSDNADLGIIGQDFQQSLKPSFRYQGVVVEKQCMLASGQSHALIVAERKALVRCIENNGDRSIVFGEF